MNWFAIYFVTGCILTVVCHVGAMIEVSVKRGLSFKEIFKWHYCDGTKLSMAVLAGFLTGTLLMGLVWPVEMILEGMEVRANYVEENYYRFHVRDMDS